MQTGGENKTNCVSCTFPRGDKVGQFARVNRQCQQGDTCVWDSALTLSAPQTVEHNGSFKVWESVWTLHTSREAESHFQGHVGV